VTRGIALLGWLTPAELRVAAVGGAGGILGGATGLAGIIAVSDLAGAGP